MGYAIDFQDEKPMLIEALTNCVSDYDAESIANVFYDFVSAQKV